MCSTGAGRILLALSSSSSTAAFSAAAGAFEVLGANLAAYLPAFLPGAAASSRSFFLTLSLFSFKASYSSSVSFSPRFCFMRARYFWRLLAAFSALPGSAASQLAFKAFSLSSLSVSLMRARVSELKSLIHQVISSVYSFTVLHSGHRCRSNTA